MKIAIVQPWHMRNRHIHDELPFVTDADFWTCWRMELQRFPPNKMRRDEAFA
jgi:hypothetical protein